MRTGRTCTHPLRVPSPSPGVVSNPLLAWIASYRIPRVDIFAFKLCVESRHDALECGALCFHSLASPRFFRNKMLELSLIEWGYRHLGTGRTVWTEYLLLDGVFQRLLPGSGLGTPWYGAVPPTANVSAGSRYIAWNIEVNEWPMKSRQIDIEQRDMRCP